MIRLSLRTGVCSIVLAAWTVSTAQAQLETAGRARIRSSAGKVRISSAQPTRSARDRRFVVRAQNPPPRTLVIDGTPTGPQPSAAHPSADGWHSGGALPGGSGLVPNPQSIPFGYSEPEPSSPETREAPYPVAQPEPVMTPYPYLRGIPQAAPYAAAHTPYPIANVAPGYPYLNAPLYTSPQQNVPYQTGSTLITNQALAPHEMLWPHEYKALYPPFYWKVHGHWWVLPWGVESYDKWELKGTEVEVKYRSHISPLAGFIPPVVR